MIRANTMHADYTLLYTNSQLKSKYFYQKFQFSTNCRINHQLIFLHNLDLLI